MTGIAIAIRIARNHLGMSAGELARRAGISSAYLSEIENGKRESPSFIVLCRIATALNMMASDICLISEALAQGRITPTLPVEFHRAVTYELETSAAINSVEVAP